MSVEVKVIVSGVQNVVKFNQARLFRVIDGSLFLFTDSHSDAIGCVSSGAWVSAEIVGSESDVAPLPEDPVEFKEVDRNTLDREMADAEGPHTGGLPAAGPNDFHCVEHI